MAHWLVSHRCSLSMFHTMLFVTTIQATLRPLASTGSPLMYAVFCWYYNISAISRASTGSPLMYAMFCWYYNISLQALKYLILSKSCRLLLTFTSLQKLDISNNDISSEMAEQLCTTLSTKVLTLLVLLVQKSTNTDAESINAPLCLRSTGSSFSTNAR